MSSRRGKGPNSTTMRSNGLSTSDDIGPTHHQQRVAEHSSSSSSSSQTRPLPGKRRKRGQNMLGQYSELPFSRSTFTSRQPNCGIIVSVAVLNGVMMLILLQVWFQYKVYDKVHIRWSSLALPFLDGRSGNRLQFRHKVYRKHRPTAMQHVVSSWSSSSSSSSSATQQQRSHQPQQQQQHPILVVGLPKAGTSTLFEFFACFSNHQLQTQHWYCCQPQRHAQRGGPTYMSECMLYNLQERLPILDGCGDYDVYTEMNGPRPVVSKLGLEFANSTASPPSSSPSDHGVLRASKERLEHPRKAGTAKGIFLPQRYHLQELHDYNPEAPWILNLRPVDDWIKSVMEQATLTRQLVEEVQARESNPPNRLIPTPRGRNETRAFLRDFYNSHLDRVRAFCHTQNHPLIEVNITDPHAGLHVVESLGWYRKSTDRAMACWGQHNVGEYRKEAESLKK